MGLEKERESSMEDSHVSGVRRSGKGRSIIAFPDRFCVLDIETSGLSPEQDSIIEIGAVMYSGESETGRFQTLVQPDYGPYVSEFITELTGITGEMLEDAPGAEQAIREFRSFLGDAVIMGYNVNFDVNFLYDCSMSCLQEPLGNDYVDVMRMARKLCPELEHHRLGDMTRYFGITNIRAHRALGDCLATYECYRKLRELVHQEYRTEEEFIALFRPKKGSRVKASDIHGDPSSADPESPFYHKFCVFTGELGLYTREEAMQMIADLGGINQDSVTKKTDFLIVGNGDAGKGGKSTKQKKAEDYRQKGQKIEILSEDEFLDLLHGA